MTIAFLPAATADDLARVEGKAELVAGRIVPLMPSGDLPSTVAFEIAVRIRDYVRQTGVGRAYADGVAYALPVPLPNGRGSFSPDASYFAGLRGPEPMRFITGVPDFAVEVRSEHDSGPAAEQDMADKRADYFAAGTGIVWDVDPLAETITVYKAADPTAGILFRPDDAADADPVLPGWRLRFRDLVV